MSVRSPQLRFLTAKDLDRLPQLQRLSPERLRAMRAVAQVLPFRANSYLVDELIDWDRIPDDPMFQLTFPQPDMLDPEQRERIARLQDAGADRGAIREQADAIRLELNPHPEGQLTHNVPMLDGERVPGLQHKYAETCLVFPSVGQTCHAFCTYCFRWAQFVGMRELKFATDREMTFLRYLAAHDEISDVLLTGGDPLVMKPKVLARFVEPLLEPEYDHIQTIRLGTKALTYWPYKFTADDEADDLVRVLERVVTAGKHLAVMAHFVHWRELATPAAQEATARLRAIGATIRSQGPLVRHVNDDAGVWARLWRDQVRHGVIPYYMFVERDTGANRYFSVPLVEALDIYRGAITQTSGLGRTARGPVMSALPGKVVVDGVAEIGGREHFVLSLLQGRNPGWCRRPFLAELDDEATWLDHLRPSFGEQEFFFESELRAMEQVAQEPFALEALAA
jgi:KamA family protein